MRALLVESLSPDLSGVTLAELPMPERAPGEVLVRVRAASLNFPDLLMTRGEYQFKPAVPFTSGLEFAGEVIEANALLASAPETLNTDPYEAGWMWKMKPAGDTGSLMNAEGYKQNIAAQK